MWSAVIVGFIKIVLGVFFGETDASEKKVISSEGDGSGLAHCLFYHLNTILRFRFYIVSRVLYDYKLWPKLNFLG